MRSIATDYILFSTANTHKLIKKLKLNENLQFREYLSNQPVNLKNKLTAAAKILFGQINAD